MFKRICCNEIAGDSENCLKVVIVIYYCTCLHLQAINKEVNSVLTCITFALGTAMIGGTHRRLAKIAEKDKTARSRRIHGDWLNFC